MNNFSPFGEKNLKRGKEKRNLAYKGDGDPRQNGQKEKAGKRVLVKMPSIYVFTLQSHFYFIPLLKCRGLSLILECLS